MLSKLSRHAPKARTVAATVTGLTLLVLALSACANDNQPSQTPSTPSQNATATATAASAGPTTNPPAPPTYPNTAEAYAKAAVAAWATNNVARLDQLEVDGGKLHTMLACAGCYDAHFVLNHCEGAAGSSYCLFFNNVGDELTLRLQNSLVGQAHAVVLGSILDPISFPSDNQAYAQLALNAWLNRNDNRLKLLTQPSMTSAQVDALGANRNVNWTFDHSEGAMGSLYYEWHDPSGHALAFRFLNGPPAPTTGPASHHRITGIVYLP